MQAGKDPHTSPRRPLGVTLLTVLFLVGGIGILVTGVLAGARRERLAAAIEPAGFAVITVYGGVVLLGALALAAGIGFARRRRWGWWLGTFSFAYALAYQVDAAIAAYGQRDAAAAATADSAPDTLAAAYVLGALVHGLIYLYLFRTRVRDWFTVVTTPVAGVVATEAGVCAAIFLAGWVVNG